MPSTRTLSVACLCLCGAMAMAATTTRMTPLVKAVALAKSSVVNIHSEKTAPRKDTVFSTGRNRRVSGMGTGIIVDERGYIVTNFHVVHEVDSLRVTLSDGSTYAARVVSFDREKDLAIIRINASRDLPVMNIGRSNDVMLAETVFAVGNAFGYEHTVTSGIVSALSRDVEVNEDQSYDDLIQTDASINPGNSGGPLLNLDGEVVGINVAIRAGAQRIGFAIPIDAARRTIAKLLSIERLGGVTHGLLSEDVKDDEGFRMVVKGTRPGSPAAHAAFVPGDVILTAGHVDISDGADFERALLGLRAGQAVEISFLRDGLEERVELVLAQFKRSYQTVSSTQPTPAAGMTAQDRAWKSVGLRLTAVEGAQLQSLRPRVSGGMRVDSVRPGSPAALNGIQPGDILLGLEGWETVSDDNVDYVLTHPQLSTMQPLDFYVYRGTKVLWGQLPIGKK